MQHPFADKVVFITGATSGIGQGIAVAFGAAGGRVVGVGRRAEAGAETARQVAAAGGDFTFIAADVSREDAVEAAIRETVERHGRLDCAVNSAAVDIGGNFVDFTLDDYERIFAANVRGLFLSMRAEIGAMRAAGGAIVNIGSISGQRASAATRSTTRARVPRPLSCAAPRQNAAASASASTRSLPARS